MGSTGRDRVYCETAGSDGHPRVGDDGNDLCCDTYDPNRPGDRDAR